MNRYFPCVLIVAVVATAGSNAVAFADDAAPVAVKQTFLIEGLHCPPCSRTVETSLKRTTGVQDIKVDFGSKNARVTFDEKVVSAQQVAQAIAATPHMMGRNMHYEASLALKVSGLKETDADKVKSTLGQVAGVAAVYSYPQQQAVAVRFAKEGKVTSAELVAALKKAGMEATAF